MSSATEKLSRRLINEAEVIKEHREKGWTAEEIEREVGASLKTSLQLVAALNKRRNDAIQNLLGVRGLLPRLYSRLLITLIATWIVLVILHIMGAR